MTAEINAKIGSGNNFQTVVHWRHSMPFPAFPFDMFSNESILTNFEMSTLYLVYRENL